MVLRAVSFVLLPLYTNYMSESEVGYIFLLFAFIAFAQIFYNHGLDSAFLKYYNDTKNKKTVGYTLISSLYITSLIISTLIALIGHLSQNLFQGIDFSTWIYYCSIILFFDSTSNRLLTVLRIENKSISYLTINIINVIVTLTASYIFVVNKGLGVNGILLGTMTGTIIRWILLAPQLINVFNTGNFSKKVYIKSLKFGLPFLPAAIFYMIMEMSDRYFLIIFSNINEVGLYGIGYKIGSIGMLIITAFNLGWQPFYNKVGKQKDANNIFGQIGSYFMFFIIGISTLIALWSPIIMKIKIKNASIIGPEFWSAYDIVPVILFSYVFYAFYIISMPSMYIHEKQKWSPIFRFSGAISNIIMNILFIPQYGMMGAAIATALSYFIMTIFIYFKSRQWMHIKYKWGLIIKQMALSILTVVFFIKYDQSIITVIILTFSYISLLMLFGFNKNVKKVSSNLIN